MQFRVLLGYIKSGRGKVKEKGLRYWGSAGLAAWEEGAQPGERMCYGEKIMRG